MSEILLWSFFSIHFYWSYYTVQRNYLFPVLFDCLSWRHRFIFLLFYMFNKKLNFSLHKSLWVVKLEFFALLLFLMDLKKFVWRWISSVLGKSISREDLKVSMSISFLEGTTKYYEKREFLLNFFETLILKGNYNECTD